MKIPTLKNLYLPTKDLARSFFTLYECSNSKSKLMR